MNKYICIHGHFYQPPRENAWLEEIEVQDSAYPYRDWNERITAECYSPNAAARILDGERTIIDISNNYSKISFNFGPTVLSWMQVHSPEVYNEILKADKESMENFSGHGSAIAQVYNHMIMPLANKRDKRTQVKWGIEDFRHRFGREPEGMWLAETAVDTETLEVLSEEGIKFTILAPSQADKVKGVNDEQWKDVSDGSIDPKIPYYCKLPNGKSIALFFYDGHVSQQISFSNLLDDGKRFADKLISLFNHKSEEPQIVNIGTDGETYGHHKNYGDMALAYCLHYIQRKEDIRLTVYGEFLEKFPPSHEVKIKESTAWSCSHGVGRWKENCGCNTGRDGWHQEWRQPLRNTLDWLREKLIPVYEEGAGEFAGDVWKLRDNYIKVILDRNEKNIKEFFKENGINKISEADTVKLLKLLEIQRYAMLMYTSCGWFFDEISGIETVQVIQYASRAIQLCNEVTGENFEPEFVKLLEHAKGNIPEVPDGARVYESYVKPAVVDLHRVTAHYAIASLFEEDEDITDIFSFEAKDEEKEFLKAGKHKLLIGKALMRSKVTYETKMFSYAFLHLGDQNIIGGVRESISSKKFNKMKDDLKNAFKLVNIGEIILLIDKHFGSHSYNIWHLFKDKSRAIFNEIFNSTFTEFENFSKRIYENNYPVMLTMKEIGNPLPNAIRYIIEYYINSEIKKKLEKSESINTQRLNELFNEASKWSLELDKQKLSYSGSRRINNLMESLLENPDDLNLLNEIESSLKVLVEFPLNLNVWKAQNILFIIGKKYIPVKRSKAEEGDSEAVEWLEHFKNIENYLQVRIPEDAYSEVDIPDTVQS